MRRSGKQALFAIALDLRGVKGFVSYDSIKVLLCIKQYLISKNKIMLKSFNALLKNNTFANIDPQKWQQEIRQDLPLQDRD